MEYNNGFLKELKIMLKHRRKNKVKDHHKAANKICISPSLEQSNLKEIFWYANIKSPFLGWTEKNTLSGSTVCMPMKLQACKSTPVRHITKDANLPASQTDLLIDSKIGKKIVEDLLPGEWHSYLYCTVLFMRHHWKTWQWALKMMNL